MTDDMMDRVADAIRMAFEEKDAEIGRLRAGIEDAVETLEAMDLHIDNPLYERLRALLPNKQLTRDVQREQEVRRIAGMTDEEITEYVKAGGRDPRQVIEEVDKTILRAKAEAATRIHKRFRSITRARHTGRARPNRTG